MSKAGDKYVITIADVFKDEHGNTLYRMEGFNSLVFDEIGIAKLEPYDDLACPKDAHIKKLYEIIERMQKQLDRQGLPYDAFGDYSGFVADEWYRENFGNDQANEIQTTKD